MVSRLDRQRPRNGPFQAWGDYLLRRSTRGRSVYPPALDAPPEGGEEGGEEEPE